MSNLAPVLAAAAVSTIAVGPAFAAPPVAKKPALQAPGELFISSTTEGAQLVIDGKPIGTLPLEDSIILLAGEHLVKITHRGFKSYMGTITIVAGESIELEMDLLPWAGIVRITANVEGGTVKVDGDVQGVTPFDGDVTSGERVITVSHPGFDDEVRKIKLSAAQTYDLNFTLVSSNKGPVAGSSDSEFYETWWFWTLIGVAGAGAATAAVVAGGGETQPLVPNFSLQVP